jgi:hypothetical protein
MAKAMAGLAIERGTLYLGNGFAYRRFEARHISHEIGRDAQFAQAIQLTFTCKGCRKPSTRVIVTGKLVVLSGWGHPNSPGDWTDGTPRGPIPVAWGEVNATMHHTRYPLGDVRWTTEFDTFLEDYLHRSGAQVLLDFRKHDFMDVFRSRVNKEDLTPEMPVLVTGVIAGRIVSVDQWPKGEIPSQEFSTLADAQKVFPDLALNRSGKRFRGPVVERLQKGICTRFDSFAVFERLSG